MNSRTIAATAIAITILGSFYFIYTPSYSLTRMSKPESKTNGVPGLEFKLSQISKSPPSLLVTLKNSNPSSTFTLLKWGTPLDPSALNLGVFKLVDTETGEEVKTDIIKIGRKVPPSRDQLQEIAPGTEHAIELVFDKPWMPEKKPAKYRVKVEGTFYAVWEKDAKDVADNELELYHESQFSERSFVSSEATLNVE